MVIIMVRVSEFSGPHLEGPNELVHFSEIKSTRNFRRHNSKSNRVICFNEAIRIEGISSWDGNDYINLTKAPFKKHQRR